MNLEFIPVLYAPGHFGTWICWLINQHQSFPKFESSPQNRDLPIQADISLFKGAFRYQRKLSDWDTYYSNFVEPVVMTDDTVNKFSFKFRYNQNFYKEIENSATDTSNFDVYEVNKIFSYIGVRKTVITLVDTTLVNEIKKRWQYLENDLDDSSAEFQYRWQLDNIPNYSKINADYLLLDVGKMLLGSADEYKKLTDFIDEPPLTNFKELSKHHYNFSFNFMNSIHSVAVKNTNSIS